MKQKKYDNNSPYFKDWTTKKLKEEARAYHHLINTIECFNSHDLLMYEGILNELEKRGVTPKTELVFE